SVVIRARSLLVLFFFQAEDGIRDFHVTGVQTCDLPISDHGEQAIGDKEHARLLTFGQAQYILDNRLEQMLFVYHGDHRKKHHQQRSKRQGFLEGLRSEERRVGKDGRPLWTAETEKIVV